MTTFVPKALVLLMLLLLQAALLAWALRRSRSRSGVLVDQDILKEMRRGNIKIEPFDRRSLGTNSYDVHLSPLLRVYASDLENGPLDPRKERPTEDIIIPSEGYVLCPGQLYLASTIEYTETFGAVPIVNGKSSLGRLGLSIHVTAGTGDDGFCNSWTLELTVVRPLKIYREMAIGQLLYFVSSSRPLVPYGSKVSAKYAGPSAGPQASRMFQEFR